jgi:hypothetical protein
MPKRPPDEFERSAAGLDYEDGDAGRAGSLGEKVFSGGPSALLEEVENLLPEEWREQIRSFPVTAVLVGLGVGVWLGMKKSDEIIAAGTSLISAAAMANVSQVMEKVKGE